MTPRTSQIVAMCRKLSLKELIYVLYTLRDLVWEREC